MARTKKDDFERKLLQHLKKIGAEEFALEDPESGAIEVMTQLEALARMTWKEALGYYSKRIIFNKEGKEIQVPEWHAPDRYAKQILFDHLLGKPKPQITSTKGEKAPKAPPVHERVGEALVGHLNEIAEQSHDDSDTGTRSGGGAKNKTATKHSLSERLRVLGMSKDKSENT